jgi:hypothetical protein
MGNLVVLTVFLKAIESNGLTARLHESKKASSKAHCDRFPGPFALAKTRANPMPPHTQAKSTRHPSKRGNWPGKVTAPWRGNLGGVDSS